MRSMRIIIIVNIMQQLALLIISIAHALHFAVSSSSRKLNNPRCYHTITRIADTK